MSNHLTRAAFVVTLLSLAACGDGNPFDDTLQTPPVDTGSGNDNGSGNGNTPPPTSDGSNGGPQQPNIPSSAAALLDTGTSRPTNNNLGKTPVLVRIENTSGSQGRVTQVRFDAANDQFIVDGLAFDGENNYARHSDMPTLNGSAVFTAGHIVPDFVDHDDVDQIIPYYAVYGTSENNTSGTDARPRTSYAIVRTGGMIDIGPGGFLYARNGKEILPQGPYNASSGQATFSGDYAGLRVFQGDFGIEFVSADMTAQIDFREAHTVLTGRIFNRVAYTEDGVEIPLNSDGSNGRLTLPDVYLTLPVGSSNITASGEIAGTASSNLRVGGGLQPYEAGTYYGAIAGDLTNSADGGEIVGVIVLQSTDPRNQLSVQETGGFILQR